MFFKFETEKYLFTYILSLYNPQSKSNLIKTWNLEQSNQYNNTIYYYNYFSYFYLLDFFYIEAKIKSNFAKKHFLILHNHYYVESKQGSKNRRLAWWNQRINSLIPCIRGKSFCYISAFISASLICKNLKTRPWS